MVSLSAVRSGEAMMSRTLLYLVTSRETVAQEDSVAAPTNKQSNSKGLSQHQAIVILSIYLSLVRCKHRITKSRKERQSGSESAQAVSEPPKVLVETQQTLLGWTSYKTSCAY